MIWAGRPQGSPFAGAAENSAPSSEVNRLSGGGARWTFGRADAILPVQTKDYERQYGMIERLISYPGEQPAEAGPSVSESGRLVVSTRAGHTFCLERAPAAVYCGGEVVVEGWCFAAGREGRAPVFGAVRIFPLEEEEGAAAPDPFVYEKAAEA